MANFFDLMGLSNSSGMSSGLTDEEQALLNNGNGLSAMLGLDPTALQSDTSSQAQDAQQSTDQSQDQSQPTSDMQIAQATDQPDVTVDDSGKASDAPTPDQTDTSSDTSAPTSGLLAAPSADSQDSAAPSSSSDSSTPTSGLLATPSSGSSANASASDDSDKPSFLHRLVSGIEAPSISQALMAAGAGMMAGSNYGTSGWSALGQGMQAGLRQYQEIQAAQRAAALNQVDVNYKNQQTQELALKNQANAGKNAAFQAVASKQLSPKDPAFSNALAASGMSGDDITKAVNGYATTLGTPQEYTAPNGIQMVQDRDSYGNPIGQPYSKAVAPTTVKAGERVINTQATDSSGNPITVDAGSLTPEQQANVNTLSTAAGNAKDQSNQYQSYLNVVQDPAYQKAVSSGVAGAVTQYFQSKGIATDPTQVMANQLNNAQLASSFGSMKTSGLSREDQALQSKLANGTINWQTADAGTRQEIVKMLLNQSNNTWHENANQAAWDGKGLPNMVAKGGKLPDGSTATTDTTRADYMTKDSTTYNPTVTQKPSQPQQSQPQQQPQQQSPGQALAALKEMARNGNVAAQNGLKSKGISWN